MKPYLFALILEFFVDWIPQDSSVEHYPYAQELQAVLQERGGELKRWEKNRDAIWLFWNLGEQVKEEDLAGMPPEKLILFAWEPPTVQRELYDPKVWDRFGKIFTWDDDLVDNRRFFKFHYPVLRARMADVPSFEEKKFCALIARRLKSSHPKQLYSEREVIALFFESKPGELDLYGAHWKKSKFKNSKGPIPDKLAVLKNYKYCICYENMRDVKGYITEKIFDCFAAGVVPIYWGASNVTDYIPADCFIDRRIFKDNGALYEFLKQMPKEEFEKYLKNAQNYLQSEKAKLFTGEQLLETLASCLPR